MSAAEAEISGLLDRAYHFTYGDGADPRTGNALATEAVGRGLLALIPLVKEIGDQLDTLPRAFRCDEVDRQGQRCIRSVGHEGPHSAGDRDRLDTAPRPTHTVDGDEFVYDGIGRQEIERLRSLLSHEDRGRLTTWEIVEIAADELARARAVQS